MKHYGYTAREASAWCRVCRPGSVVGPQQQYLETKQNQMWEEGRRYRQDGGAMRRPKISAGRQRPGLSSAAATASRKQRPQMKTFDTVEECVTARLLTRIQQEADGVSTASSNGGIPKSNNTPSTTAGKSSLKDKKSASVKNLQSKLQRGDSSSAKRPSTTETVQKSVDRGGGKGQYEASNGVRVKSRGSGSASTSALSNGSAGGVSSSFTDQNHGSAERGAMRRAGVLLLLDLIFVLLFICLPLEMLLNFAVVTERRPNTSAGVTQQRTPMAQKVSRNGSSNSLRSGGGLKNMSAQSNGQSSGSVASSRSTGRVGTSHSSRVPSKRV